MIKENIPKKKQYSIRIGPLMKKVLDAQLQSIKEVTYDSVKSSYYEAAEIVAKKVLGMV